MLYLLTPLFYCATAIASPPTAPPDGLPAETQAVTVDEQASFGQTTASTLYHEPLSRTIEDLSQQMDSYFGAERTDDKYTASYGRLRITSKYARGGELSVTPKFQLRLKLPSIHRYLKFNVELDAEENEEPQDHAIDAFDDLAGAAPSSNFSTSISPGITYDTDEDTLDPYLKIKFQYSFPLMDWATTISQSFERYRTTGNGARTNLTLLSSLGDKFKLTLTSKVYHNEEEYEHNDYQVTQEVKLSYQPDPHWLLSTEASIQGKTEPNWQHDLYTYNVRLRKDIHKGYVFLELKPEIEFDSEDNFHGSPSISLRLEVYYGAKYLYRDNP